MEDNPYRSPGATGPPPVQSWRARCQVNLAVALVYLLFVTAGFSAYTLLSWSGASDSQLGVFGIRSDVCIGAVLRTSLYLGSVLFAYVLWRGNWACRILASVPGIPLLWLAAIVLF